MKKRGVLGELFVVLIAAVIGLIIMMAIVGIYWAPSVENIGDDAICRLSIALNSLRRLQDMPILSDVMDIGTGPIDLKCEPHELTVKNGKSKNDKLGFISKDLKEAVADEMVNCWWRFGEGRYDFYTDASLSSWFKTNDMCFVCAEFKGEGSLSGKELFEYMRTKDYKHDETYLTYISGTGFGKDEFLFGEGDFKISDEDKLYVMFIVNKDEGLFSRVERGLGTALTILILEAAYKKGDSTIKRGIVDSYNKFIGTSKARQLNLPFKAVTSAGTALKSLKGVGGAVMKYPMLVIAAGAGTGYALFKSEGFNANIVLHQGKDIRDICEETAG